MTISEAHAVNVLLDLILQSAAMTLGVPAELIADIDDGARRQLNRPGFIAAAIAAQAEHDKQRQEGPPQ
jgi:hypothetical protein